MLDETRKTMQRDALEKMDKATQEAESLAKELRYTQQVVADELASWQEERVRMGRQACRDLAKRMVVAERARLEGMLRAVRGLGLNLDERIKPKPWTPVGGETKAPVTFLPKAAT